MLPLSRPESVTSMAKPNGAPNPFVTSHASYPGPLGALPADEIAGNDLGAPLVMKLRHSGRLDGHHRRVGCQGAHLGGAQIEELGVHLGHGEVGGDLLVPRSSAWLRASAPGAPATVCTATRPLAAPRSTLSLGRSAVAARTAG